MNLCGSLCGMITISRVAASARISARLQQYTMTEPAFLISPVTAQAFVNAPQAIATAAVINPISHGAQLSVQSSVSYGTPQHLPAREGCHDAYRHSYWYIYLRSFLHLHRRRLSVQPRQLFQRCFHLPLVVDTACHCLLCAWLH